MIDAIRQELNRLGLHSDEVVIIGSSILGVLGIRKSNDIDILVSEEQFENIASRGNYQLGYYSDGTRQLIIDNVELTYQWDDKTVSQIMPDTTTIKGIHFLSLDSVRKYKERMGRPKDKRDIILIDAYLASQHDDASCN